MRGQDAEHGSGERDHLDRRPFSYDGRGLRFQPGVPAAAARGPSGLKTFALCRAVRVGRGRHLGAGALRPGGPRQGEDERHRDRPAH